MNTYSHYANVNTQKSRTLRQQRIARGVCVTCGHVPPRQNSRTCSECLQNRREADKHTVSARRRSLIEKGLCVRCGSCAPVEGKQSCAECREKHRSYERARVLRREEKQKDREPVKPVDVADVEIVDIRGTGERGSQWWHTFSVDMPTIFEPESNQ